MCGLGVGLVVWSVKEPRIGVFFGAVKVYFRECSMGICEEKRKGKKAERDHPFIASNARLRRDKVQQRQGCVTAVCDEYWANARI